MNSEQNINNNSEPNEAYEQWNSLENEVPFKGESEEPDKPEQLREPKTMVEQLERMGVKTEIINNPAFRSKVGDVIRESGFSLAAAYSIKRKDSETATPKTIDLVFTGDKNMRLRGDSFHDAGRIKITVGADGNLQIQYACIDESWDAYRRTDKLKNSAKNIDFSIIKGGGLSIATLDCYESGGIDYESEGRHWYNASYSKEVSTFDSNGAEILREMSYYPPISSDREVFRFIARGDRKKPNLDRIGAAETLMRASRMNPEVKYSLTRNDDGETMRVYAYREVGYPRVGQSVEVQKLPINNEHGTSRLVSNANWDDLVELEKREAETSL